MQLIDSASAPLGIREIARQMGFGATIVQRFGNRLESEGYIEQVVRRQGFAVVNEEDIPGIVSVGTLLRDHTAAAIAAQGVARAVRTTTPTSHQDIMDLLVEAGDGIFRGLRCPQVLLRSWGEQ